MSYLFCPLVTGVLGSGGPGKGSGGECAGVVVVVVEVLGGML